MPWIIRALAVLGLCGMWTLGVQADDAVPDKQLTLDGGITITYPPAAESQAQIVAGIARRQLVPRVERFNTLCAAMTDDTRVARRISEWLGPQDFDDARSVLHLSSPYLVAFDSWLKHIRLFTEEHIKAVGEVRDGPFSLVYLPETDTVTVQANSAEIPKDPEQARAFYTPLVIDGRGKIRMPGNTAPAAPDALETELCEGWDSLSLQGPATFIHEAVEGALVKNRRCHHPFARWFNEGLANWLMITIVKEVLPKDGDLLRKENMPVGDDPFRAQINLLTWAQYDFREDPSQGNTELDNASYAYATEAVDRMLRGKKPKDVAAIIQAIAKIPCPTTEILCQAISRQTRRDAKDILLDYVPKDVRAGIKKGLPARLSKEAQQHALHGRYQEMITALTTVLCMTPDDLDTRFNLAWALRKTGAARAQVERQLTLIEALHRSTQQNFEFHPVITADADSYYLMGCIFQRLGDTQSARRVYGIALQYDPQHADAQAALTELDAQ